jgi:hypothetical protein
MFSGIAPEFLSKYPATTAPTRKIEFNAEEQRSRRAILSTPSASSASLRFNYYEESRTPVQVLVHTPW